MDAPTTIAYVGLYEITVKVSDQIASNSYTYYLNVTNSAPRFVDGTTFLPN